MAATVLYLVFGQKIRVLPLEVPDFRETDHVHEVTEGDPRSESDFASGRITGFDVFL
jgi:hypothetical protein